jgi:hypothetical protein
MYINIYIHIWYYLKQPIPEEFDGDIARVIEADDVEEGEGEEQRGYD